jgi:predicted nuclease of restriction endonuclease-like (RecB) superfamily
MNNNKIFDFGDAAGIIKDAIIRSRYQAAKPVNKELLGLYCAVGRYISENSRSGSWGKGAIRQLSDNLQRKLPGLRGFSEGAIKKMRLFYEEWSDVFLNRSLSMNDLCADENQPNRHLANDDLPMIALSVANVDLTLLPRHMSKFSLPGFTADEFYRVGFTHHYTIMAAEKSPAGRLFYISRCAQEFWTVDTTKSYLRGELYARQGSMPNNFRQTLSGTVQATRAIQAFKDEYLLDFINIEDKVDPDERLFEHAIIANIKQFILTFGNKFCFIGNQHRVSVGGEEFFIDLLFFNRELHCLVAVELKRGKFNPAHLGQLNFYLSALDEFVKQDDENPSIGILLCKEANRNIVEFAVRDYTKPMGVATYRTRNEMPETWQKALPDFDDMRKLLETAPDENGGGE